MSRAASEGWERWPNHADLLTGAALCRWCHVPLDGRKTSWCSKACELEVANRCNWDNAVRVLFERQRGVCQRCGLDTEALREAINAYQALWHKYAWGTLPGEPMFAANQRRALMRHWPTPEDFRKAIGKAAARWPSRLWDANHIKAVIEGGSLCEQSNLETLCLCCHQEHTAGVVARNAKVKRIHKKFGASA